MLSRPIGQFHRAVRERSPQLAIPVLWLMVFGMSRIAGAIETTLTEQRATLYSTNWFVSTIAPTALTLGAIGEFLLVLLWHRREFRKPVYGVTYGVLTVSILLGCYGLGRVFFAVLTAE